MQPLAPLSAPYEDWPDELPAPPPPGKPPTSPLDEYKEKLISAATRSQYLSFIRGLFRIAADEWKWLSKAPVIKTRKPISRRIKWLTREEALTLIECMPDGFKPIVIFALATGVRRSKILDLEWSQIGMQRRVAWIHPENAKAGKAIGVALNDTACKVLKEQIGRHHKFVFVHNSASTALMEQRLLR